MVGMLIAQIPACVIHAPGSRLGYLTAKRYAGRCMKRHENTLRIGTFWHQIGGDRYDFGWLKFHFDLEREGYSILSLSN